MSCRDESGPALADPSDRLKTAQNLGEEGQGGGAYFEEERNNRHLVEQKHVRFVELVPAVQELQVVLVCDLKRITWKTFRGPTFSPMSGPCSSSWTPIKLFQMINKPKESTVLQETGDSVLICTLGLNLHSALYLLHS